MGLAAGFHKEEESPSASKVGGRGAELGATGRRGRVVKTQEARTWR